MSSFSSAPSAARTSAAINADIRALWKSAGGRLSAEDETVYARLLVEWAAVSRAEGADGAEKAPAVAPAAPAKPTPEPARRTAEPASRTAEPARRAAA